MTKKLTWKESWGKVDWNTVTAKDIQDLIDKGADVALFKKDSKGREIYPWTIINKFYEEATTEQEKDRLMEVGLLVDRKMGRDLCEHVSYLDRKYQYNEKEELKKTNWRALTWEFVSEKVIKEILKKGLDVNEEFLFDGVYASFEHPADYTEATPLHCACARNNMEAVKALIELGADPNRKAHSYYRHESTYYPIDWVNSLEVANYLIEHGAKLTPKQMLKVKQLDKNRSGLLKLLDSLNQQEPTEIRKAAKVAAIKEYRKNNPKSAGR